MQKVYELYCLEAKVFTVGQTYSSDVAVSIWTEAILLVMQVRCMRKRSVAIVIWDLGFMSKLIREAFSRMNGFKGTEEHLNVTTLGGVTTDLTVLRYECSLRDMNGKLEKFEAYGMETIRGCLSRMKPSTIKKLFFSRFVFFKELMIWIFSSDCLMRTEIQNVLKEQREVKISGFINRGKFDSCLSGGYPWITERTSKSNDLFHVNHSYNDVL